MSEGGVYHPEVRFLGWDTGDEEFLDLEVNRLPIFLANALRRIMLSEVPTMALDLVLVAENSSVLSDEQLVQKLTLIPLTSHTVERFITDAECPCLQHCSHCAAQFNLDVRCPDDAFEIMVTSDHLVAQNPDVRPVSPCGHPFELVKLARGQSIRLTAFAKKNIGKTHAKWQPVCGSFCHPRPSVTLRREDTEALNLDQRKALVACCPRQVFRLNPDDGLVDIEDANRCDYCGLCVEKSRTYFNRPDMVSVQERPTCIFFHVETKYSLNPTEVFLSAIRVLRAKLQRVRSKIPELKSQLMIPDL